MRTLFVLAFLVWNAASFAQPTLLLRKQRPPELDVSAYKQVVVGDIVAPLGSKNEQSLDLTDALTARLFNGNTLEVIDRNALDNIFGSQRFKDLQVLDEQTKQLLNKKLSNALLITGRIQSQQLQQKLIYNDQSIVVNGCSRTYFYQVKGDVTIQLKILDVKTGRMIFSNPVIVPVLKQTKEECQTPNKLDIAEITRNAINDMANKIAQLVVPYEYTLTLKFSDPGLLKSPFKKLKEAVINLQMNNAETGLIILKAYTDSKDVKERFRGLSWYNYGLGLFYAGKGVEAKAAFQQSAALNPENLAYLTELIKTIDDEAVIAKKLEAQALQRTAQENNPVAIEKDNTDKPKKVTKPAAKSKGKN